MSMTRRWSLLTAVLIVGILAASWFLLVSPKRSDAAMLRSDATKQKVSNEQLVQSLNELKAQQLDLPKKKAELAVLGKQIPDNPALPTLIRDLSAAGKKVGVSVVSMKPGSPTAAVVAAPVAAVAPPAATTEGTATPAAGDTTSTTTDAAATPEAVAPVVPSLYVLPLTLEISGSYFEVEQFINKLEGMQRTFLLTGFTLKPFASTSAAPSGSASTSSSELALSITGQVFLAPTIAAPTSTPVVASATTPAQ
jgi:Tfp pilus assembly protein PilO